jgi:3'(2'), 5'-bisphosphate nucleotidase
LLDHVTVLIGVAVKGEPVAGVIHQPYFNYKLGPEAQLGRTIWGIVGLGMVNF